jgi:hypothetical protein
MAYTPELSYEDSCTLRRIAWALGIPMTRAISEVLDKASTTLDRNKVCEACKDKTKCEGCIFNRNGTNLSAT